MYLAHGDRKPVGDRYNAACLNGSLGWEAVCTVFSMLTFQGTMSTIYAPTLGNQTTHRMRVGSPRFCPGEEDAEVKHLRWYVERR